MVSSKFNIVVRIENLHPESGTGISWRKTEQCHHNSAQPQWCATKHTVDKMETAEIQKLLKLLYFCLSQISSSRVWVVTHQQHYFKPTELLFRNIQGHLSLYLT